MIAATKATQPRTITCGSCGTRRDIPEGTPESQTIRCGICSRVMGIWAALKPLARNRYLD
jgi:hypothetical protein